MLREDDSDTAQEVRTDPAQSGREPLGSTAERRRLKKRVLGGEDDFKRSLITPEEKGKSKKRSVASLNRRPVWEDEDTDNKAQFEQLVGQPKWARLDAHAASDSDDSDLEDIDRSTGTRLASSSTLAAGIIDLKRCPDANSDSPNKGKLTSVRFHPKVQIVMTAATDMSVRLFQVDGRTNKSLQTIFLDNFPVMSAEFNPFTEEIVMGSKHRSFYSYDMMSGKVSFIPKIKGLEETNMARLKVTPDGKMIVFMGQRGNIHLLSAKSKEWIHTLHMNGEVADVTFSRDGGTMFSTGDDGRVYLFDLSKRQSVHHFYDDGCVHGTCIDASSDRLACGSNTGVVNVYDLESCRLSGTPRPEKAILNLTTSCTTARFNHSGEILGLSSNLTEKAVKLVHVPSLTVFSNFPAMMDSKLRIACSLDFSPNGGYLCAGNHKGHALLYRVKHYSSY